MAGPVFRLAGVRYAYPGKPAPSLALEIADLEIREGEVLALTGPNGAGKTTLLNLLALLIRPGGGRLEFLGRDPWTSEESAARARRATVLLTHHPYLFKGTIGDNVAFGLKVRKLAAAEVRERVKQALALVELDGWQARSAYGLSAGQAQRVALARVLALRPRALLLDEPTANLDAGLGLRMESVLREAGRTWGGAVVFSSHDFSQATRLGDSILYLSGGRRVEFGHENCFSGAAGTNGRMSWIEPRPGLRITFAGRFEGHVTCLIDPAAIGLSAAPKNPAVPPGPNVFRGRISRMETTGEGLALVRVSGDLVLRVIVPLPDLEAADVSLSDEVLLTFEPGSVRVAGARPDEPRQAS
jgi:tungstate transport system ATP-binding protein